MRIFCWVGISFGLGLCGSIYFLGHVIYKCSKNRPNGRVVGYQSCWVSRFWFNDFTL